MTAPRTIGPATVNLSDIQAAINALPPEGGTVTVAPGTYTVDAVNHPITLRSHVRLDLSKATLVVAPNSAPRYYAVLCKNVTDVEIIVGHIVGDRDGHTFASTSTDEWGMGIGVSGGARITITGGAINRCNGDAICIGGKADDVIVQGVRMDSNRRQGISVTACSNVTISDCEITNTHGTSPECGIDIEPDAGYTATNIYLLRVRLAANAKYGANVFARASNVTFKDCIVEDNASNGIVTTTGSVNVQVIGGTVQRNGTTGVLIQSGSKTVGINGVTFFNNYHSINDKDRVDATVTGYSTGNYRSRDILIQPNTTGVVVGTNTYK